MKRVFIEDWLASDVSVTPVSLRTTDEAEVQRAVIDDALTDPPELDLGDIGALTRAGYTLYNSQGNPFVEKSEFYFKQSKLSMTAVTQLYVPRAVCLRGRLWATGVVDVWVNGERQRRITASSRMYPKAFEIRIDCRAGLNVIFVREQNFGAVVTREMFAIELDNPPRRLTAWLPGGEAFIRETQNVRAWLDSLNSEPGGRLTAVDAPPCPVTLCTATGTAEHVREKDHTLWPAGENAAQFLKTEDTIVVHADFSGQRLTRRFEHIENTRAPSALNLDRQAMKQWQLSEIAKNTSESIRGVMPSMARRMLGKADSNDDKIFLEALTNVDGHPDCADFYLAGMLRTAHTMPLGEEVKQKLKEVCLRFRYWPDEDGADAMVFHSENHQLLFHSCQLMAGKLYKDDLFILSGRTGAEQVSVALKRCGAWADRRIQNGFDEFLSSTYIPLTLGAMTLVYDFCGDDMLREKFRLLCDKVFEQMAMFSFGGVAVGPQGRVYRNVLRPFESGVQAILCYIDPHAAPSAGGWMTHFFASGYEPPESLTGLSDARQDLRQTQADVGIVLYKTEEYLLTSLELPSKAKGYLPGQNGGQQHIAHAALSADCHVFVNHAGCAFDFGHSRPGYWYGNGVMPAQLQEKNLLLTIYNIPDQYPFAVTHAYWPNHIFDEERVENHWAFGRCKNGYIALWCSELLKPYSHTLQNKELRAEAPLVGWMTYCAGAGECPSFTDFIKKAKELNPYFDNNNIRLSAGAVVLEY